MLGFDEFKELFLKAGPVPDILIVGGWLYSALLILFLIWLIIALIIKSIGD